MTYLITGATGFIGKRLVEQLLSHGHSVQYFGRTCDSAMDSRAIFHLWADPAHTDPPLDSVPATDALIHLAGEPIAQRWSDAAKKRIWESRVASTRRLVDAFGIVPHRPKVLVAASAIGYYGNRGEEVLTESSPPGTGFLAELCKAWEQEAARAAESGIRVVSVRNGIVLGAGGGALAKMMTPFRLGLGGKLGDGQQWMSWIHRDDVAKMMQWAAENDSVTGPLNGTAPHPVTNAEFTKVLARMIRRPAVIPIPQSPLRAVLGEMAGALFDSIRALPQSAETQGFSFDYNYLTDALQSVLQETA